MNVLVLGASGFVGSALVPMLLAAGESVRAASRSAKDPLPCVQAIQCDVRDPDTLPRAFAGIDCVYYLVHSMGEGHEGFREAERRSAEAVARVAAESGVRRIVYLGGVQPTGHPSDHLASRLDVGATLRSGRAQTVELRAAMIIGNGSTSWKILRDLALRLPFMVLPRWLQSRSCPIALADVMTALLDARMLPVEKSAWFDIPGPELLSAYEMLMIVAELDGRRVPTLPVPLLTPRLSARWLRLVSGADYEVAKELVLGLEQDLFPQDRRYWELTGHPPVWSFRMAAEAALRTEPRQTGLSGWLSRQEERAVRRLLPRRGSPEVRPPW
jgi:uncharacterized protein YbjT (DUF2867 family)